MKRLFDITVATILLLVFSPIILSVALCIKLDSPGPILYASPRVGKYGKRFGLLRFRTVDLLKPSYLSMRERLSRVGRFIRRYGLDDLPNLLNILKGDLSLIGPRATEPERVDLSDPIWQEILSVRPGAFSPAIMQLATQYNASPNSLKQQLEFEYVQKQSFMYDLHLFWQAMQGLYISKGNWKARGKPTTVVGYLRYQEKTTSAFELIGHNSNGHSWHLAGWDQPDLSYATAFTRENAHTWNVGEPQFSLVPCAGSEQKAAIFLRFDKSQAGQIKTIQLQDIQWLVLSTNRYVCLGCVLCFESGIQEPTKRRYVCSTLLDVASPAVETWFSIWRQSPETVVLFVSHDLAEIQYHCWVGNGGDIDGAKEQAILRWEEVKIRLQQSGFALENFAEESQLLHGTLLHFGE